jgi:ABC-type dipeptide/oligopeptide/nickel transport system permease subunit
MKHIENFFMAFLGGTVGAGINFYRHGEPWMAGGAAITTFVLCLGTNYIIDGVRIYFTRKKS